MKSKNLRSPWPRQLALGGEPMKRFVGNVFLVITIASLMVLVGCSGASSTQTTPPPNPPVISNSPPPPATRNLAYPAFAFVILGGTAPFTWSETGALPTGLMFSSSGQLSGTPTITGSFPITVKALDSAGQNAAPQSFTIQVFASGFAPTGAMQVPRVSHTATLLNDGDVLVTGDGDTAELFNPASGTFTLTSGNTATARLGPTATLLQDGTVLVTGGGDNAGNALASSEIYNPANGLFTSTGSMGTARVGHTVNLLRDGTVLVTGGADSTGNALASAEIYDPASKTFSPTGPLVSGARRGHTANLLQDGTVLVTGGADNNGNFLATSEIFDPSTGRFTATGSLGTPRWGHTATLLNSGAVLVAGGQDSAGVPMASAELFDPATGFFTPTAGSMWDQHSQHTATLQNDGTVLIAGGLHTATVHCDLISCTKIVSSPIAEVFDPNTGTFTQTGELGTARHSHTATLLNDGRVLVTGGTNLSWVSGTGQGGGKFVHTVLSTAERFQ